MRKALPPTTLRRLPVFMRNPSLACLARLLATIIDPAIRPMKASDARAAPARCARTSTAAGSFTFWGRSAPVLEQQVHRRPAVLAISTMFWPRADGDRPAPDCAPVSCRSPCFARANRPMDQVDPDKTVATGSFRTAGLKGDSHTKRNRWQSSLSFPLEPLS